MTRPSYKTAVAWIAFNDNDGDGPDAWLIRQYITTALVADLFDVDIERVARDVARRRLEEMTS